MFCSAAEGVCEEVPDRQLLQAGEAGRGQGRGELDVHRPAAQNGIHGALGQRSSGGRLLSLVTNERWMERWMDG